jgi:benzoyl-CoA 2,3-epoxidase subunit B
MNELKIDDAEKVRAAGVVDLETLQRYLNFHFSVTIDLFGADQSSNAATFYSAGLKGRYEETKLGDDHVLKGDAYRILGVENGGIVEREVGALSSLNERLRDDYIKDSIAGVGRWNRIIERAGIAFRLKAPHKAFNRKIGTFAGIHVSPEGKILSAEEWRRSESGWLPTAQDRAFVAALMGRVAAPGKFANWIAPPPTGVNRQPADFEYVRFN